MRLFDEHSGIGVGALDFFDNGEGNNTLNEEMIEKWWCIGDVRNRVGMWIQGDAVLSSEL